MTRFRPFPLSPLIHLGGNRTLVSPRYTHLLAAVYCAGKRTPSREVLDRWLNTEIPKSQAEADGGSLPKISLSVSFEQLKATDLNLERRFSGPNPICKMSWTRWRAGPQRSHPFERGSRRSSHCRTNLSARRGYDRFTGLQACMKTSPAQTPRKNFGVSS